jgi:uncharacterized protein with NRDE domain
MCLILVAWRAHPDCPLVVAANRDEFFNRPTAAASFWPGGEILAGRDLQAGGTWMGMTVGGRFAAVTNFRDPLRNSEGKASRGQLVADFLADNKAPLAWLDTNRKAVADYNPFNLLVGDPRSLVCYSNVSDDIRQLGSGVYGLSNHLLDTPWPKVETAKSSLSRALAALPDDSLMFDLLHDDAIHPDHLLPRTGVSLEWERLLSAAFVKAPGYGTRSSTILKVSRGGTALFDEQTWLQGGKPGNRSRFRFSLSTPASYGHGEFPLP